MKITDKLFHIDSVIMIDSWHEVDRYLENNQKSANYRHFSKRKAWISRISHLNDMVKVSKTKIEP